MRPDETCVTNGIGGVPCKHYYFEGQKHRCRITDEFQALRRSNDSPRGLVTQYGREFIYKFYIFCVPIQPTTNTFGITNNPCIKCGLCCKNDYSISQWRAGDKLDPKTNLLETKVAGRSVGICQYLTYDSNADNGSTDHGYRCSIYGQPEFPDLCRDFPDGKDEEFFEAWLNSTKQQGKIQWKNHRFSQCPFEVEEVS